MLAGKGIVQPVIQEAVNQRSVAKAISWRIVGTIDTLILSYVLITYLGPIFGMEQHGGEALETASYIAITEVITKMIFFFLHERVWAALKWGTTVEDGMLVQSLWRTTVKTTTWRIIASLDTMLLAYFFTGNIGTAISIGGLEVVTKLMLYFFHERAWAKLPYGIDHSHDNDPSGGESGDGSNEVETAAAQK